MDERTILVVTAAGGVILLGVALRLLDLRQVRVASLLPRSSSPRSSSAWPMRSTAIGG